MSKSGRRVIQPRYPLNPHTAHFWQHHQDLRRCAPRCRAYYRERFWRVALLEQASFSLPYSPGLYSTVDSSHCAAVSSSPSFSLPLYRRDKIYGSNGSNRIAPISRTILRPSSINRHLPHRINTPYDPRIRTGLVTDKRQATAWMVRPPFPDIGICVNSCYPPHRCAIFRVRLFDRYDLFSLAHEKTKRSISDIRPRAAS